MSEQLTSQQIEFAFYREVAENKMLYTIIDDKGIPTPTNSEGELVMPFWSNQQNALNFIEQSSGFNGFKVFEVDWEIFSEKWIPGIAKDDLMVGLNWQQAEAENCVSEVELLLQGVVQCLKSQPIKRK